MNNDITGKVSGPGARESMADFLCFVLVWFAFLFVCLFETKSLVSQANPHITASPSMTLNF